MKKQIAKLVELADRLDSKGMYKEADDIDDMLTDIEVKGKVKDREDLERLKSIGMEMINRLIMNFPDAPREYLNYCKAQGLYGSDWYNDEDRDIKLAPWKGYVHTSTEEEVLNNFGHFPCEWVEEGIKSAIRDYEGYIRDYESQINSGKYRQSVFGKQDEKSCREMIDHYEKRIRKLK